MRILKARVFNFASYKDLEFSYENLGLALIQGLTGSGKSTLADIAPWIMFGVTAKDGSVDEVRSWGTNEATEGRLTIDLNGQLVTITRIRGKNQNDLYWNIGIDSSSSNNRGKDIPDTQRLISDLLGFDGDTYLAATYFSEFSDIGRFFSLRSKERRTVLERICDTGTADALGSNARDARKAVKETIQNAEKEIAKVSGSITQLKRSIEQTKISRSCWDATHHRRIEDCKAKAEKFEETNLMELTAARAIAAEWVDNRLAQRSRLENSLSGLENSYNGMVDFSDKIAAINRHIEEEGSAKCSTCGGPKAGSSLIGLYVQLGELNSLKTKRDNLFAEANRVRKEIKKTIEMPNPHLAILDNLQRAENTWAEQLEELQKMENPHHVLTATSYLDREEEKLHSLELDKSVREGYLAHLNILYDLSADLRGAIIQKSISQLEHNINQYLETYFDNEISVELQTKSDSVDVNIHKNGHECTYTQLSRGQRSLLRLCFVVAIQKAIADASGESFSTLVYDEVLDGLDSSLKIKAFALLESVAASHETILCVDHATDFQNLFETKFHVSLEGDCSYVAQE